MKIRIDFLKLASSDKFGAFDNRTFGSLKEAKAWVAEKVPKQELDLIKVWADKRLLSGTELEDVTGQRLR